ncbi:hypothetical protein EK904_006481 [Melospiza melodia maxima]|nr:hypothetical protein EK904_006481 [Melospiza melodia maxima]
MRRRRKELVPQPNKKHRLYPFMHLFEWDCTSQTTGLTFSHQDRTPRYYLKKKKKGCRVQSSFGDIVYYATFIFLLTFTLSHYNNTDRVKTGACWTTGQPPASSATETGKLLSSMTLSIFQCGKPRFRDREVRKVDVCHQCPSETTCQLGEGRESLQEELQTVHLQGKDETASVIACSPSPNAKCFSKLPLVSPLIGAKSLQLRRTMARKELLSPHYDHLAVCTVEFVGLYQLPVYLPCFEEAEVRRQAWKDGADTASASPNTQPGTCIISVREGAHSRSWQCSRHQAFCHPVQRGKGQKLCDPSAAFSFSFSHSPRKIISKSVFFLLTACNDNSGKFGFPHPAFRPLHYKHVLRGQVVSVCRSGWEKLPFLQEEKDHLKTDSEKLSAACSAGMLARSWRFTAFMTCLLSQIFFLLLMFKILLSSFYVTQCAMPDSSRLSVQLSCNTIFLNGHKQRDYDKVEEQEKFVAQKSCLEAKIFCFSTWCWRFLLLFFFFFFFENGWCFILLKYLCYSFKITVVILQAVAVIIIMCAQRHVFMEEVLLRTAKSIPWSPCPYLVVQWPVVTVERGTYEEFEAALKTRTSNFLQCWSGSANFKAVTLKNRRALAIVKKGNFPCQAADGMM